MTAEEYEQACASGLIDADTQAQIASAVSKKNGQPGDGRDSKQPGFSKKQELIDRTAAEQPKCSRKFRLRLKAPRTVKAVSLF